MTCLTKVGERAGPPKSVGDQPAATPQDPRFAAEDRAQAAYEAVKNSSDPDKLDLVAKQFPGTFWAQLATTEAARLRSGQANATAFSRIESTDRNGRWLGASELSRIEATLHNNQLHGTLYFQDTSSQHTFNAVAIDFEARVGAGGLISSVRSNNHDGYRLKIGGHFPSLKVIVSGNHYTTSLNISLSKS